MEIILFQNLFIPLTHNVLSTLTQQYKINIVTSEAEDELEAFFNKTKQIKIFKYILHTLVHKEPPTPLTQIVKLVMY